MFDLCFISKQKNSKNKSKPNKNRTKKIIGRKQIENWSKKFSVCESHPIFRAHSKQSLCTEHSQQNTLCFEYNNNNRSKTDEHWIQYTFWITCMSCRFQYLHPVALFHPKPQAEDRQTFIAYTFVALISYD